MNPNKKPTPSTIGVLPPSPAENQLDVEAEIEMSLRLVCSMSGNRSKAFWEDVTDNTPMTVVLNNSEVQQSCNKHNLPQAEVVPDPSHAVDLQKHQQAPIRVIQDTSPGSVQFTSLVSASFWLVHCPNWMSSDVISLVDQLYKVMNILAHNKIQIFYKFWAQKS